MARMAQGPDGPVYGLGPVLFPHSGEVDFHQLGLEPYRLPVERYGLPNIDHLWEPRQGGEIQGELKALAYPASLRSALALVGSYP